MIIELTTALLAIIIGGILGILLAVIVIRALDL